DDLDVNLFDELYPAVPNDSQACLATLAEQQMDLDSWMEAQERQLICEALSASAGNITKAAEKLGISFRSLRYRLKKLDLNGGDE
ncbi:MAG: helix-turn-helix domain-containing protein, partial [Mariprofundaceae bacterium]